MARILPLIMIFLLFCFFLVESSVCLYYAIHALGDNNGYAGGCVFSSLGAAVVVIYALINRR